jgi:hypothetical protein
LISWPDVCYLILFLEFRGGKFRDFHFIVTVYELKVSN